MNNEPVAYGMFIDGDFYDAIHADEYKRVEGKYDIPLYSHPVKEDAQYDKGFDEGVKHGKTIYEAEIEVLKQVLGRYVKEVPLGNQPHMLAHIALELVNG